MSDSQLIHQIQKGDHTAFDILFDKYWDKLYKAAYVRLKDEQDAKDIVQELLISFWHKKEQIQINTSLENYLFGALRLSTISHFRSLKINELRLQEATERMDILEDSITNIEDYLLLEHILEEAVNLMPETLKKIYDLRCNNLSVKEIALELGLADQTVKNYISEVLRRLRQAIAEKYPEKHLTYLLIIYSLINK